MNPTPRHNPPLAIFIPLLALLLMAFQNCGSPNRPEGVSGKPAPQGPSVQAYSVFEK